MKRKPERPAPPRLPRDAEVHAPRIPAEDPPHKESPPQASARAQKRGVREQKRRLHEKHWLAPAGSKREKQFLSQLGKLEGLSKEDRDLLDEWKRNPKAPIDYNLPFWRAAKKPVLGTVVYELAMERHRKLNNLEWLVAYFTVQGKKQEEIAQLTGVSPRMVDEVISTVKYKISQDLQDENEDEKVGLVQIARWFFGL